jgi:hypothetical protein
MTTAVSDLQHFEPGVFILINDVMTGVRKLARVTEAGSAYLDLDGEDGTPLPIYAALKPEEAGNILGWGLFFVDREPQHVAPFRALCERLVESGEGVITYNRAAHWAFTNRVFDYDRAMAEAKAQTARVMTGRSDMDAMIRRSGGAL